MVSLFNCPNHGQLVYYTYSQANANLDLHELAGRIDPETTQASIAACFRQILQLIGEDPDRQGLQRTPDRYAEAILSLTRGYSQTPKEVVNDAIFDHDGKDLVIIRDIDISSLCEHHVLPFTGKASLVFITDLKDRPARLTRNQQAHIGYIPRGKVVGLSKLARIADIYAQRLQMQERLTQEIAKAIHAEVEPRGVRVVLECQHMCMCNRGVQKPGSSTVTSSSTGSLRDNKLKRQEFDTLLGLGR
ncbi:GTP cyclohydrolase I [Apiospora saccharicola]|uniref:GTP cyclohydrolase 1 n=1 Tax=Apiospora saccharicola TaxID=335842 RepID=A0ABR1W0N2_9PEZI